MKRIAKILAIFIAFLIAAILLIPVLFKDKIKELVINEFRKSVDAELYFGDFNLSLIRNFPDFTLGLSDMGIVGKGIFDGDTLLSVANLNATVDLQEVMFGESISLKSISLSEPDITIITLSDGTSNYDIAKETDSEVSVEATEPSEVSFGIKSFKIEEGEFVYFDQTSSFFTQLASINVSGSGDFQADIFDLITEGQLELVDVNFDGTDYVTDKTLQMDVVLSMDLPNSKYTFKENEFNINTFPLSVDGYFALLEEGFGMDLNFKSPGSEFKQLLSLVPGVYNESFEDLEAEGNLSFSGHVSGQYSEETMPGFGFDLTVKDGWFQYPDLPEAVSNVQMGLNITNQSGVIEHTRIDLSQLHLEMGKNPLDAKLVVENLQDYEVDADIQSKLDLAELSNYLPLEGYELKGILDVSARANGIYDSIKHLIPQMDIKLDLSNGFIKTPDVPAPIEDFKLNAAVTNQSGKLRDTQIEVINLGLVLDDQPFSGDLLLSNPDDFAWDVNMKGNLDLDKLMKLYPVEGMNLKGQIATDISTKGKMSDLEAHRYNRMPTKGNISLTNFDYQGDALDQPITISKAIANFSNDRMELTEYTGKAGSTSYSLSGRLSNYLGFALNNETLSGDLKVDADQLIISEWMTDTEEDEIEEPAEALEVVRVPKNIQFNMEANVGKVMYNTFQMSDMKGKVRVNDGKVRLDDAGFKALNGSVGVNGEYDSNPEQPTFSFKFGAREISIPSSFQSVDIVQKLAPVTEKMTGLFSTDFTMGGALGADMMPDYSTITGSGLIEVLQASLGQSDLLSGLTSVTKLTNVGAATLEKVKMSAEIKDGRLFVKPFDVRIGDYKTTISGSTGIDGSLDYLLRMNVPAGQVGTQLNSLVTSLTGGSQQLVGNNLVLNIGMGGVFTKPEFGLKSVASADGGSVKNTVTTSVKAKVEEKKEEVKEQAEEKVEEVKDSATVVVNATKDSLKAKADTLIQAQKDSIATIAAKKLGVNKDSVDKKLESVKDKAKGALKGLLRKKKKKKKKDN